MIKNENKTKSETLTKKGIITIKRKSNLLLFLIVILLCSVANAQNTTPAFLTKTLLPLDFKNQLNVVNKEFMVAYGMRQEPVMDSIKNYTYQDIQKFIYQTKDYEYLFRVPFWTALDSINYSQLIPELISKLTDTTYVGLTNANDVTIWSRVKSGDLKPNPLNYQIDDDVFTVAGRASWLLKRLSKNEFGIIKPSQSEKELIAIQKLWQKWLKTLVVK